jgi:dTDP-4-amino-4,6-dideoxygalactose transaminase
LQIYVPRIAKYHKIRPYLRRIDKSKMYSNFGDLNNELERRLANHLNIDSENIALCSNGTLALMGLCQTISPEKRIFRSPSWTFTATPLAITQSGHKLRFIDIDEKTWESNLPNQDHYGIHVLAFGSPLGVVHERKSKIAPPLIIDAAASFMNLNFNNYPKNRDWAMMVSLHATKGLSAGEGSFIYSNNKEWVKEFKTWSNFGFQGTRETKTLSINAKMSEYSCAVALANLDSIKHTHENLKKINSLSKSITENLGLICQPAMSNDFVSPYWIVKFLSEKQKNRTRKYLALQDIPTRDWWGKGCHMMPYFSHYKKIDLKHTNVLAQKTLGLPFHTFLSRGDFSKIAKIIESSLYK